MQNPSPAYNEKLLSQIPALKQLINLGYTYLSPKQALEERYNKNSNILLEKILTEQLRKINRIHYRSEEYLFSEENIQAAIQKIKNPVYDGLLKTSENIYDLLTLGTSLEQALEGNLKSFPFKYIDFNDFKNNVFHVTAEFSLECRLAAETRRADIVIFINGIPLVVIECKKPSVDLQEAIYQLISYQKDENIPKLFTYAQILIAVNSQAAKYATTASKFEYWAIWREQQENPLLTKSVHDKLSSAEKEMLFQGDFSKARRHFNILDQAGERAITEQDRLIFSLCERKRLLDLVFNYIVYDSGNKKIARYQQYFVIKATIERILAKSNSGLAHHGGMIWHTQGSGKSLTMVMLVRSILMSKELKNPRILLVTDRLDLDKQLANTFKACGLTLARASSGRNLLEHLKKQSVIISTVINKFDKAMNSDTYTDESSEIFVLVDESHRTNFGNFAASMRKILPNACYLGFTGTPLLKEEKNNFRRFGDLIEPHYSIRQAVEDKAVVPLLYEARLVDIRQNQTAIDLWFERHTEGLSKQEKADLKKKFAKAKMLQKTDQVVYTIAFDISEHFRKNWQGTGFKAQLVAPNKKTAIKYHNYLNEIALVSSQVVISPPEDKEGEADEESEAAEVNRFWKSMMDKYGTEKQYAESVINEFQNGDELEILIVVDKLLTGFDAPRNTILYLCRILKEHTLLQAIARVNRLCEKKEYGFIIDYAGVGDELGKAFNIYDSLSNYDAADIEGAFNSIDLEISRLPQLHSNLYDHFKDIPNKLDEEAYEQRLANEEIREAFHDSLSEFSKALKIALSSETFIREETREKINLYKESLKRFFNLKEAVKIRYAEGIDYKKYDKKIEKLMNTHIYAGEVIPLHTKPLDIFDEKSFKEIESATGFYEKKTLAARADMITSAMKKEILEKLLDTDPEFYKKFSERIQAAIDDFRAKRISDLEYLKEAADIRNSLVSKKRDDVPEIISSKPEAAAYYATVRPFYERYKEVFSGSLDDLALMTALEMLRILDLEQKVDFWNDENAKKRLENLLDDFFFDEIKAKHGLKLELDDIDELIERLIQIAKSRRASL